LHSTRAHFFVHPTATTHIYTLSLHDALPIYQDIMYYTSVAYQHYKPIGVATGAQSYLQPSEENNLAGVIFTANNPNFGNEFVDADRKSTRLNSSHVSISYAVFCLKKKNTMLE